MFSFGKVSTAQIEHLHPELKAVITEALSRSKYDFGVPVTGGVRTAEQQRDLWLQGRFGDPRKIVTEKDGYDHKSNHQVKDDGFGYAVDIVPFMGGKFTWAWEWIFPIIATVGEVAREKGVSVRWGGVWDRKLEELDLANLEDEVNGYCQRHPGPDHIDGPHLEYLGKIAATKGVSKK